MYKLRRKTAALTCVTSGLYLSVSEVPLELLEFHLWQRRIWSILRCATLSYQESLKIDLYAFCIIKIVICETNIGLGPCPRMHSSFHIAFRYLRLILWKTELLMQMTTQSDFDFGLDANYQTRIFFIFYLSL